MRGCQKETELTTAKIHNIIIDLTHNEDGCVTLCHVTTGVCVNGGSRTDTVKQYRYKGVLNGC